MIILSEVATKLEKILNGSDSETSGITNPTDFYYQVETEGFHIDHIKRPDKAGNFIPVFISSMGGQFNPVKGLKQGSYSFSLVFYFPVRFKEQFYALGDFLVDAFVGTILNYGTISGSAVSNISVPQFGEIQNLDFNEFKKWVQERYEKPIEVMEPYLTMQLSLYLTSSAQGLLYGNDFTTDLSFTIGETTYTLEDVDTDGASLQSNSQTQSEQEEGTNESDSLPFGTTYGASFKVYPNLEKLAKNETNKYFYRELLKVWFEGGIQEVECDLTYKIKNYNELTFVRRCYIQSIVAPIEKGQLFSLTLTFAKKTQY